MPSNVTVQLPSEAGNAGKKISYQQRLIGGDPQLISKVIVERSAVVDEVFNACVGAASLVLAGQNGTTSAFAWLVNQTTDRIVRVRKIRTSYNFIGTSTLTTLPPIVARRFTFTGVPSGPAVDPMPCSSSANASASKVYTASTGMSVTLVGSDLAMDLPPIAQVIGAAATFETTPTIKSNMLNADSEDEWISLAPNTGLVVFQNGAGGATTETRRVALDITFGVVNPNG